MQTCKTEPFIMSPRQKGNITSDCSLCHSSIAGCIRSLNTSYMSCLYGINVSGHQSIRIRISIEAIDRRVRCVPDMSSSNYSSARRSKSLSWEQNKCLQTCGAWNWFVPFCNVFSLWLKSNSIEAFYLFLPGCIAHTAQLATTGNLCKAKSWKTKFAACGFNKYSMKMGNPIHSGENM